LAKHNVQCNPPLFLSFNLLQSIIVFRVRLWYTTYTTRKLRFLCCTWIYLFSAIPCVPQFCMHFTCVPHQHPEHISICIHPPAVTSCLRASWFRVREGSPTSMKSTTQQTAQNALWCVQGTVLFSLFCFMSVACKTCDNNTRTRHPPTLTPPNTHKPTLPYPTHQLFSAGLPVLDALPSLQDFAKDMMSLSQQVGGDMLV
jgi:hypothetical protein